MAIRTNEVVKTIWCDRLENAASLVEQRVYLTDTIAATAMPKLHVIKQRCSHDIECNLSGCACRWSFLGSDYDPFTTT